MIELVVSCPADGKVRERLCEGLAPKDRVEECDYSGSNKSCVWCKCELAEENFTCEEVGDYCARLDLSCKIGRVD